MTEIDYLPGQCATIRVRPYDGTRELTGGEIAAIRTWLRGRIEAALDPSTVVVVEVSRDPR